MKTNRRTRAAVGLSGGVDSSVAAALLKEQGYDVIGITMEIFGGLFTKKNPKIHACYGPGESEDIESASRICDKLGIPFFVIDLKKEYTRHVISYVRSEYLKGRTPNPCIVCNQKIKFGFLLERVKEMGIDFELFATGHYARVEKSEERYFLKKAIDTAKDQSYFLYKIKPDLLPHIFLPLGSYTKKQVRYIARSYGFETMDRSDSQDFIEGGNYSSLFLKDEIREGEIVDEAGNSLGKHRGIIHYTLGQRRGLGIGARRPLYVVKIDARNNRIVVGEKEHLFSKGLVAGNLNIISPELIQQFSKVKAKIRLQHIEADAVLQMEEEKAILHFDKPQIAVTPGQSVVLYIEDVVVGGGTIEYAL